MIADQDYHTRTIKQMCAVGQTLRAQAYRQASCIQSAAWVREGVTPPERSNMIERAREANAPGYAEAFAAWQEHYVTCQTCKEALRP